MKAIINSSPLIAFASINKIGLLTEIFSEVIIPLEVYKETVINGKKIYVEKEITNNKKFVIQEPTNLILIEFLNDFLDKGESEVIALAKESGIENVIIDEAKGRKIATRHQLNVIGSLGILVVAKSKELIPKVKTLMEEMESNGIRIGKELKNLILEKAGEL